MLLIAHRGSSGAAPENTLAAFRQAVRDGADLIELDVRLSADGELMVIHDRRLFRTTRVRGRVGEWTAEELEELDAGAWYGRVWAMERIPRLVTVLRMLPPTIGLNIEVKTDGDRHRAGRMAERLGGLLQSFDGSRDLLVSSFDHGFLRQFHRRLPAVPVGVLYLGVRDLGRSPELLARRTGASVFVCSRAQLRTRWIRSAHAGGIRILVYGVETVPHMLLLLRKGVDGIMTNHPARLRGGLTMQEQTCKSR